VDEHQKNNVIGEFVAKIVLLAIAWFIVIILAGIGLKFFGDDSWQLHEKLIASGILILLYFRIDRWFTAK
jgi:low affinity Fe/Cu permease